MIPERQRIRPAIKRGLYLSNEMKIVEIVIKERAIIVTLKR